jgi:hypothetical protein
MRGWWVLPVAILAVASAAALLLGAEAQSVRQGHQTERISGEGPLLALCVFLFPSCIRSSFDRHVPVRLLNSSFLISFARGPVAHEQPIHVVIWSSMNLCMLLYCVSVAVCPL